MNRALITHVAIQIAGLLGVVAFLHGVGRVYRPAAWIVGGLLLMAWAVLKSTPLELQDRQDPR